MTTTSKKSQMLQTGTPTDDHTAAYGLWVKREDMACLPPGPPFSKTRGVFAHIEGRPESVIGVLDTFHSQAGHAVARACQLLGKRCINFYPEYKHTPGFRAPQERARELGAELVGLQAGRSAVIYHTARRVLRESAPGAYLMPNALKLAESVSETAKEVRHLPSVEFNTVILPSSSATIAAGVIQGFASRLHQANPSFIIHMGYSRSAEAVFDYVQQMSGVDRETLRSKVTIVDEGYEYKDQSRPGETPSWPCNPYYDLKAFRWWLLNRAAYPGQTLLWNVG